MNTLSTLLKLGPLLINSGKKLMATWNGLSDYLEEKQAPDWLVVLAPFLFFGAVVALIMVAGSVAVHFTLIAAPIVWSWLILLAKVALVLFILWIIGIVGMAGASSPGGGGASQDTLNQILRVERERLDIERQRDFRDKFGP